MPRRGCRHLDGVHSGHKKVLESAVLSGHFPVALVINRKRIKQPSRPHNKRAQKRAYGKSRYKMYPDIDFEDIYFCRRKNLSKEFLVKSLGAVKVSCGFNFKFEKRRRRYGGFRHPLPSKGMELGVISAESFDGKPVSSTRIRKAIESGKVGTAAKMLSRYFSFDFPWLTATE